MVPTAFEYPEQALECSSLQLDLAAVSEWALGIVKSHGLHDGDRSSWRTAFGKTWAEAWPAGPRVVVPCFCLEARRIRRGSAGVQVFSMGVLPVTQALCSEPSEFEAFRLSEDEGKVKETVSAYLKTIEEATRKFMERYAQAKKEVPAEPKEEPKQ